MSEPETNNLTIPEAVKLLKVYSCNTEPQNLDIKAIKLRKALLLVAQESEWENIGICADNLTQGLNSLKNYLAALGYHYDFSPEDKDISDESVYIKFNTQKMSYYTDKYLGSERGFLIATQGEEEAVLGTFGYFPLDLFS